MKTKEELKERLKYLLDEKIHLSNKKSYLHRELSITDNQLLQNKEATMAVAQSLLTLQLQEPDGKGTDAVSK